MKMTDARISSFTATLLACVICASLCAPGFSLDRDRNISQFYYTFWSEKDGAPSQITALAQTEDGYLWMGSERGLFRFDGIRFEEYKPQPGMQLPSYNIFALMAAPDGGLWIAFSPTGLAFLKNESLRVFTRKDELPDSPIHCFARDHEGRIWAGTETGLVLRQGARWIDIGPQWNLPREMIRYLLVDREGTLCVATVKRIAFLRQGSNKFELGGAVGTGATTLAQAKDGRVWSADDSRGEVRPVPVAGHNSDSEFPAIVENGLTELLFDRDGALWITRMESGIIRIRYPEKLSHRKYGLHDRELEAFDRKDGFSGGIAGQLLEDREGNIWVGCSNGLIQFRHTDVVPVSLPQGYQKLTLLAGKHGGLRVGTINENPLLQLSSVVPPLHGIDRQSKHRTVPQAHIDPRPIRLPIVDGTDIRFTRLSTAEGSLQSSVRQIAQDDQGFMWFGTPYGLNRFDGYSVKLFAHDPSNPKSLSGEYINALFEDRQGALWVGCDEFLNKLELATETFTRYAVPFVTHVSEDTAGVLWLATRTGLYSLDPETGRIHHYFHDPNDPSSLSSNDVKSSGEDKEGNFWVANTEGLDEFDRRTGKITLHIPLHEPSNRLSFYEDRVGVFWIFHVSGNALAIFNRNTNTLRQFSFYDQTLASKALTGITSMLEDRNGTLWLGTHGAGLLKFDRDHRRFICYRNNPADANSLPQNSVDSLFADREGDIWAGMGRMGLVRFASMPLPFTTFLHNSGSPFTMSEPFVGAIYEDHQGILWIGTPDAIYRIDRKAGHYTAYRRTAGPPAGTDAITIGEDRSGNLWVGTYGHGLLRFDRRTGQFKTYLHNPADPYSLSDNFVSRLLVDHNGTLWAASSDALNRFDAATGRFTRYKFDPQRKPFYLELVEDRLGALWLGTDSLGLQRFNPVTGKFTVYQHDLDRPRTLSDNRVNSVHFDRSGTMWVGTQNGLDKFDPKTNTFTVYNQQDGLPGNAVGCILEDNYSDLWMSTNNGVSRFNPPTGTFGNYSITDGLPGLDLTGWGACFKSPSGEMFLGGFSGATAFFPDKVMDTSYIPPIVFTDFRLYGNPVEIGSHSPLHNSISYARDLILSHNQSLFSLTFAALSFANPATNRYRYKLEGLERDWNVVGSDRRQVTYTTLPAGTYTFRAQGATSSGAWSEPGVALRIRILPPWWGTWWFRLPAATFGLFLMWSAYRYRLHQIIRRLNLRLEERLAERTRIARELHDTLLQGLVSASMQLHVADAQLPADSPAKPLVGHVLELMSGVLDEGRNAIRGLRTSPADADYLEKALSRIPQELAAPTTIDLRVIVEGVARPLRPEIRDEVYLMGREALLNAFHHSRATQIEAELDYATHHFRMLVRDNGCGIDPRKLASGFGGHWGLSGMRERAERVGGELKLLSRADTGTEIELCVPGSIAFESQPSDRPAGWLSRLYSRRKKGANHKSKASKV